MNPWDIPAPNADDPSPRIIKFAPARKAGPGALADGASSSLPSFHDRTRRAIEARLNADAHLQTLRHRVVPDLTWRDDLADWLERTFADRLGWFIATLFPLCVAAACIGYFGIRELLAGFGL